MSSRHTEVLDRLGCLRLLAGVSVGRVVFTERALPAIRPVNFVLDAGQIVIRSAVGSAMQRAAGDSVVAFEADQVDAQARIRWSVVVTGWAHVVKQPEEIRLLEMLALSPWAEGSHPQYLLIQVDIVSGRILIPVSSQRTDAPSGAVPAV